VDEAAHKLKGERNERFIVELETAKLDYKDWIIVAAFYSAIHYVMYHFHKRIRGYDDTRDEPFLRRGPQGRFRGHLHRKRLVMLHLPKLLKDYEYLYAMAREARYGSLNMARVTPQDLADMKHVLATKFRLLT
jgi:hypothetical protein